MRLAERLLFVALCGAAAAAVAVGCGSGLRTDDMSNQSPTADALASTTLVKEGVLVDFDGSGSSDPEDAQVDLDFQWDFGDTPTATGMNVSHAVATATTYTVTRTVTDTGGRSATDTVQITVTAAAAPPVAVVEAVTLKGNLADLVAIDDHVTVTVTPPGTPDTAPVDGGTGDFAYQVAVGSQDLTVDVVGEDTSGNSDSEQVLVEP